MCIKSDITVVHGYDMHYVDYSTLSHESVSYAYRQIWYHIYAKVPFCMSIPPVFVFIWHTIYTNFYEIRLNSWLK